MISRHTLISFCSTAVIPLTGWETQHCSHSVKPAYYRKSHIPSETRQKNWATIQTEIKQKNTKHIRCTWFYSSGTLKLAESEAPPARWEKSSDPLLVSGLEMYENVPATVLSSCAGGAGESKTQSETGWKLWTRHLREKWGRSGGGETQWLWQTPQLTGGSRTCTLPSSIPK